MAALLVQQQCFDPLCRGDLLACCLPLHALDVVLIVELFHEQSSVILLSIVLLNMTVVVSVRVPGCSIASQVSLGVWFVFVLNETQQQTVVLPIVRPFSYVEIVEP